MLYNFTLDISNKNIDLDSLQLLVSEDNGQTNTIFSSVSTLFGLNSQSNIFFLQGAQNQQYEIVFGDNLFGKYGADIPPIVLRYLRKIGRKTLTKRLLDLDMLDKSMLKDEEWKKLN